MNQVKGIEHLKKDIGNILFFPHYDAYMSILPILATNNMKLTILMDESSTRYWEFILSKFNFGKNIRLHGIQEKNSILKVLNDLKNGYNLVMYPEFSLGKKSKFTTKFLNEDIFLPTGIATIAKKLKTNIIPIQINYPDNQLLPYIILSESIDSEQNILDVSKEIMKIMENIISKDKSKWWGWEIWDDMIVRTSI
ncbi:LpxL/LpxP family acyltransferase [Streptococcus rifensis]